MKNIVTDPEKVTRVLKTATEVLGQQGFIKSKTDRTANQVQASKGLLLHYFDNKQALYLGAFKYVYHRIYDRMDPKKWQSVPGLAVMITTAVKYGLKLQLKFPAEYRLMM